MVSRAPLARGPGHTRPGQGRGWAKAPSGGGSGVDAGGRAVDTPLSLLLQPQQGSLHHHHHPPPRALPPHGRSCQPCLGPRAALLCQDPSVITTPVSVEHSRACARLVSASCSPEGSAGDLLCPVPAGRASWPCLCHRAGPRGAAQRGHRGPGRGLPEPPAGPSPPRLLARAGKWSSVQTSGREASEGHSHGGHPRQAPVLRKRHH